MTDKAEIVYSIIEYLNSLKQGEGETSSDTIDTITGLLEAEFSVTSDADNFKKYSYQPIGLKEIFEAGKNALTAQPFSESLRVAESDPKFASFVEAVVKRGYFEGTEEGSVEYLQRYAKLLGKFKERVQSSSLSKDEAEKQAEELKLKGNASINAKDYATAIKHYTDALNLSTEGPNSHVYYCNRAAAYCFINDYQSSVDDCLSAIALQPDYPKAYSRLGLSYFHLERYEDAINMYEKAGELEPDNKATQESLRNARNRLRKRQEKSSRGSTAGDVASVGAGLPGGLAGMMKNPAMQKALDQVGGADGLSNLMKDPAMMAMAQQMMSNPAMMQQAMSMLGGGGAGGMPDMSALAGLMGGLGGNAPPSSSSSGSNSKKPFKGFEE